MLGKYFDLACLACKMFLHVEGKPSVDDFMETHQQSSLDKQSLAHI
jgi:hypothetical protein